MKHLKQALFVFLILSFVLISVNVFAGANPVLTATSQDTEGAGSWYEIKIGNGEWVSASRTEDPNDQTVTLWEPLTQYNIPDGVVIIRARACNIWACGEPSDPFEGEKATPVKLESLTVVAASQ